jgi:metallophosphoesterase (TIGR03767 family)
MEQLTTQKALPFVRTQAANGITRTALRVSEGEAPVGEAPVEAQPLATFIHLSDLHICDTQSPARVEFLDRYADPDYPSRAIIDYVGTYRPQEFLTLQVLEAMVQSANQIETGPLLGKAIDGVLITGDVIDNGQANELSWYKTLLEGGPVAQQSGDPEVIEASHATHPNFTDQHYYKPDSSNGQRSDEMFGMVQLPGLVKAAHSEFEATGLKHNWYAIHGNHDAMLQGTVGPDATLDAFVTGNQKLNGIIEGASLEEVFAPFSEVGPSAYPPVELMTTVEVTPDPNRRFVNMDDWVDTHLNCEHDHGISQGASHAYWTRDFNIDGEGGTVRVIALDTVNPWSGWQGCVDRTQFMWLSDVLEESKDKYVVLTSHHPLVDLVNGYTPAGEEEPALEAEVRQLLGEHPNVILWVAGHVHDHNIGFAKASQGEHGFWQIRTGSHMDWPQQSRVIEIAKTIDGRIAIGTVVFNHAGTTLLNLSELAAATVDDLENPLYLAGISRVLAANDWQRFAGREALEVLEGKPEDRNAWLWLQDPLA